MRISRMFMKTIAGIALCILLLPVPARADEEGKASSPAIADLPAFLDTLGKKVSNFKTLKTDFTQEKEMALFTDKIVLKGRIYIQKPGKIVWHVDKPIRYSVLITDKLIRQWDEDTDRVQEISLSKNPIFQVVLNQLTVWFSGEYGSLLESHEVKVVKQDPLEMEFRPREKDISSKAIRSITITFRQDRAYLERIRIKELSGDVTTIHFKNTLLNAPLDSMSFEVKGHV
jgi:outer membrane lipoprotein-sorting protein